VDYRASGRTVESLGIEGLSVRQIHQIAIDPDAQREDIIGGMT